MHGCESQASELFNEMLQTSVRLSLFAPMEEEINSLCGAKYPSPISNVPGAKPEALKSMEKRKKFNIRDGRNKEDGEVKLTT